MGSREFAELKVASRPVLGIARSADYQFVACSLLEFPATLPVWGDPYIKD